MGPASHPDTQLLGTSKGVFFHHVTSKLDPARSLADRYDAADLAHPGRAAAQAQATTGDPAEQAIALVRAFEDSLAVTGARS
jgi:TetR/AcrR family transcriptional regulator, transcriptional repressor for nem operon